MPVFVRLAPEQLETRDTPSLPQLEPFGGVLPIPVPPSAVPVALAPAPAPVTAPARPRVPAPVPVGFWERGALECASGVLVADHTVYKLPLVWPLMPR